MFQEIMKGINSDFLINEDFIRTKLKSFVYAI